MSLKAKIEAIIYAAETPITLDQIVTLVKDSEESANGTELRSQVMLAIGELKAEYALDAHGIEIREVAGGYRMSTKPEQHELVRSFAKSLKPPIRLSLPALETLAVIAYKQPVTVPEISAIRGVDSSGVIPTRSDAGGSGGGDVGTGRGIATNRSQGFRRASGNGAGGSGEERVVTFVFALLATSSVIKPAAIIEIRHLQAGERVITEAETNRSEERRVG